MGAWGEDTQGKDVLWLCQLSGYVRETQHDLLYLRRLFFLHIDRTAYAISGAQLQLIPLLICFPPQFKCEEHMMLDWLYG